MKNKATLETIDDYIARFPDNVQDILQKIRMTIKEAAPEAEETISYQMPTFKLNGNLVHFAAYQHHIGFYPAPSGIATFKKELARFEGAKGSVQFPLNKPVPFNLIRRIVKFRVQENMSKKKVSTTKTKTTASKTGAKASTKTESDFPKIGAPALRALHNAGYTRLEHLKKVSKQDVAKLHGMGPKALGILERALAEKDLAFKS